MGRPGVGTAKRGPAPQPWLLLYPLYETRVIIASHVFKKLHDYTQKRYQYTASKIADSDSSIRFILSDPDPNKTFFLGFADIPGLRISCCKILNIDPTDLSISAYEKIAMTINQSHPVHCLHKKRQGSSYLHKVQLL